MNKKKVIPAVTVLLVAAAAGGWWYFGNSEGQDESRLVLYGNVDIRETDLAFNNSEHIERLLVQEGDRVRKGQLLATLHRERIEAEVAAADARVAAQRAAVARLEVGSRPEEVRQARANVAAARARLSDAQVTFTRTRDLSEKKLISRQALDNAQTTLDTARADLDVAQQALALAVEGPRVEDIEEARALLKASEAQLVLAREVLKDTELYAPAAGVIRDRLLEPGDMVSPQTPVLTLALTDPVWVRAYASERYLGRLAPGMSAEVSTDSYPGKTYRGWIGFISPTAEFTPKTVETPELRTRLVYQVRVHVCNPQDELRLGMPATVTIPLDQPKPEPGHASNCAPSGDD
ncbi:MAG: efflux RND transporter periplasmic adaptor subunit [Gammaproteobacteria bacterium]|jgi:HlyD family secretion protein